MSTLTDAVLDSQVLVKRNLIKIVRVPEILVFTLVQPIMFVLLFAYVFGSAIKVTGSAGGYREFLIAGIFAQTTLFGATFTGAGIAEDMQKGVMDRFRSLPMSRSAVLVGRTLSDVVINLISVTVMALTGLAVGWRIRTSVWEAVAGFALLLFFAYAFSWIMAYVGLIVPSPEVVNNASFIVIFPLTFIANTFVPLDGLPHVLKVFAEWNPVSSVTQACRDLFGNASGGGANPSHAWPVVHPEIYTIGWALLILAVFVPLSVREYKRAAGKG
jgi:ABC-2 type transport system permease protein